MALDEGFIHGILCCTPLFDTTKVEKRPKAELIFFFALVYKGSIVYGCVME